MTLVLTGSRMRVGLPLLRWMPDPIVLVEPQEYDKYRVAHADLDVRALPENDRGFAYLLNRMVDLTLDAGERYFVFTDDDVTDLRSRADVTEKFGPCRGSDARAALDMLVGMADDLDVAQFAVSFAGASWSTKKPYQEPVGAWGVHVTDAQAVRAVGGYDESLPIFNDWEMSARLIAAGYRCTRTNLLTFVHKMRSQPGGASDLYEQQTLVADAARRVVERYPWAAKVQHVEAHGLDEVRFNWKRLANPPAALPF